MHITPGTTWTNTATGTAVTVLATHRTPTKIVTIKSDKIAHLAQAAFLTQYEPATP